jgi:hypothetical protein
MRPMGTVEVEPTGLELVSHSKAKVDRDQEEGRLEGQVGILDNLRWVVVAEWVEASVVG